MVTVVETEEFLRRATSILADAERETLIFYLACHPQAGTLIQESGGLRKVRWGTGGRGKRGGARVIYYFHSARMPLYLLTIYAKGMKADLSPDERCALRGLVKLLRQVHGL